MTDQSKPRYRLWTNHAGGYQVCSHCPKKASKTITDHDCCGRCRQGREHLPTAMANYAGPGTFAHDYWETYFDRGVCGTCHEPRDAH